MAKDRTGELCPACGKGTLYPTGQRMLEEPQSGKRQTEFTVYECTLCHTKYEAGSITEGKSFDLREKKK
jgi:hypothetical protein